MNRISRIAISLVLLVGFTISGCSNAKQSGTSEDGATKITLWSFVEMHLNFYEDAAKRWNEAYPNRQIELETTQYPYAGMHRKLILSLQSGVGAPDIADVEINKFGNYLKGKPQLTNLNDLIEPVKDQYVQSRLKIYSKNGKLYGIPTHLGSSVMFYNKNILDEAGVDPDNIVTWDDFIQAGKKIKSATGKPMLGINTTDVNQYWPMVLQRGSHFINNSNEFSIDTKINADSLKLLDQLVHKYKIAVPAPGGDQDVEKFYGFMSKEKVTSVLAPMWYMSRFVQYMPDLKNKIIVRPMPKWTPNGDRSAGIGGTGTVIPKQTKHPDLAKDFLKFAKVTKEANIQIWKQLGFIPPRADVYDSPKLQEPNKFNTYFLNDDLFEVVREIRNEINGPNVSGKLPRIAKPISSALHTVIRKNSETPAEALEGADKGLK
ncbi:ABC transporter substrate-binding protein [Tuberibacillus sp. Marseille-P3662]|uniref:ABC transporter substrate-binding protein n=1 Tax=Tuberibacillus sp. Marseille-P3662 TaxID=1965358 RepID=UPI000A1CCD1B|nr:ABC transporter substrate-binding protein [Tuberibacillus sp. Marseille-P3662]